MAERSIFGLRLNANEAILPSPEEMCNFLESAKASGKRGRHKDDLAPYLEYLRRVELYEVKHRHGVAQVDINEQKLFGALLSSHFFRQPLRTAVEQYKYYLHALATVDFKKPTDFIRSAETEIGKLKPKREKDALKIARLRDMIDQRTKSIEALKKRQANLLKELENIAAYIQENMVSVHQLCESAITFLVNLQISGEKKSQLIEDIKTHYKEQVRDQLQLGPVTKQFIEELKGDVAKLSEQLSQKVLEDVYSITKVYEDIYEHTKRIAGRLDDLIPKMKVQRQRDLEEDKKRFGRIEQVLVSLVSEFHTDAGKVEEITAETEQDRILYEKRKEMLDHVFDLLEKNFMGGTGRII